PQSTAPRDPRSFPTRRSSDLGSLSSTPAPARPAASGGTITFVLENDVIDFDPMLSRAFVDRNAHYQIYDSLVRVDPTGKIIPWRSEEHTSELQSRENLVCRLL